MSFVVATSVYSGVALEIAINEKALAAPEKLGGFL